MIGSFPLNETGIASALLCGFFLGYLLEVSGWVSPDKLTAQMRWHDCTLIKVLFLAATVAAVGVFLVNKYALISRTPLSVPAPLLVQLGGGGALVGLGFALGGYLPSTALAATMTGRVDGLWFVLGMVSGGFVFAKLHRKLAPIFEAKKALKTDTLATLLFVPEVVLVGILAALLLGALALGWLLEHREPGPVTAAQIYGGE